MAERAAGQASRVWVVKELLDSDGQAAYGGVQVPPSLLLQFRVDEVVAAHARQLALRSPGQADEGNADYRARTLTDVLLTALALETDFSDAVLEGPPLLITHRQASSLFRLGVAASATRVEQRVFTEASAGKSDRAVRIAELLHYAEDIAWHGYCRRQAMLDVARWLFTRRGETHTRVLAMLDGQGKDFGALRARLGRHPHGHTDEDQIDEALQISNANVWQTAIQGYVVDL